MAGIRYNPLWMDNVFISRKSIESLLLPERESGNVSPHDYNATVSFFADSFHRAYPLLGSIAAGLLVFSIPKRRWSALTRNGLAVIGAIAGEGIGTYSNIQAHHAYVRSLDNPRGFRKALDRIQAKVGAPKTDYVVETREHRADDVDQVEDGQSLILPSASDSQPAKQPAQPPRTRWDEIRSANNRSAQSSVWETIRQRHERKAVNFSPNTDGNTWIDSTAGKVDTDRYANYDDGDKYSNYQKTGRTR